MGRFRRVAFTRGKAEAAEAAKCANTANSIFWRSRSETSCEVGPSAHRERIVLAPAVWLKANS